MTNEESKMSVTIYINDRNEKARVHEDDCDHIRRGEEGNNGGYRYFNDYEDAWEWIKDNLDDYDFADCSYCNPEE
jgi:hypothetical protein